MRACMCATVSIYLYSCVCLCVCARVCVSALKYLWLLFRYFTLTSAAVGDVCQKRTNMLCAALHAQPLASPLRHRALPSPLELRLCTKSRSCNQGEPNQARSAACFSRCCCQANKATATGEREIERRGIHRERVSMRGGVGECVAGVEVQLCGWAQDCCLIGFIHVCYFARFAADN